jgi:hypothetical protein
VQKRTVDYGRDAGVVAACGVVAGPLAQRRRWDSNLDASLVPGNYIFD